MLAGGGRSECRDPGIQAMRQIVIVHSARFWPVAVVASCSLVRCLSSQSVLNCVIKIGPVPEALPPPLTALVVEESSSFVELFVGQAPADCCQVRPPAIRSYACPQASRAHVQRVCRNSCNSGAKLTKASLSFAAVVLLQFYWTCVSSASCKRLCERIAGKPHSCQAMGRGMCKSGANRESRKERSLAP